MFLFKKPSKPTQIKQKIKISSFEGGLNLKKDENLLPMAYAHSTYNFSHAKGALVEGLGVSDFTTYQYGPCTNFNQIAQNINNLGAIKGCYHAKRYNKTLDKKEDKLMILASDMNMYVMPLSKSDAVTEEMQIISNLTFEKKPVAINYRLNGEDCTIFSSPEDVMAVWGLTTNIMRVIDAPHISSMAIHYERLFATVNKEQSSVWFSDDLDPTNWSLSLTEAGFIEMVDERGPLKKVLSFNDYIYIFRDYGITRLSAFAEQANFGIAQLFIASGKIYPETVTVCGDIILFLASDGLYKFNGLDCIKILTNIEDGFINCDNSYATAGYFENKYYLACKFNFGDEQESGEVDAENNCLIEIDLNTMQTIFLRGVNICHICVCLSEFLEGVVVCAKAISGGDYKLGIVDHSGKIFGNNTTKVWQSALTDLGYPQKYKCVRNFYINTNADIVVTLKNESNETETINIKASNRPAKMVTRFFGDKFSFKISCNNATCKISNPNIYVKMDNR